jgi:Putative peptidoglycan binding domain
MSVFSRTMSAFPKTVSISFEALSFALPLLLAGSILSSAAQAQTGAQSGTPDPIFNARDVPLELSAGSILRRGDRLTDALVATIWTRMAVKGSGTCSANACPVIFNGEEVFARRTRITIAGRSGDSGTSSGRSDQSRNSDTSGRTGADGERRRLQRGDKGDEIRRLQDALVRDGARLTPDGSYGRSTQAAVSDFQRRRKLKVDGIAGGETLKALGV